MKVAYSRCALRQLASIYNYLIQRNPSIAADLRLSIKVMIGRLASLPRLGKSTDVALVRVIIEPTYLNRIFYRIYDEYVIVLRILHGSQS